MKPPEIHKGRGALTNPEGRFESIRKQAEADGWDTPAEPEDLPPLETVVRPDPSRSIISRNQSPDIPFSQSINPYKGCEHGCIYCYARPSHAYLNLSPGLDFETKLFYKADAAALLDAELRRPGHKVSSIMLGANTDPYQPVEKEFKVTRSILEVMRRFHHPVSIITKGTLITRDLDILTELAQERLVTVMVSITTLDDDLKRSLEPRAASPRSRLKVVEALAKAGVPVGVMTAPIIPMINDAEMERILELAAEAGACSAGYVLLRLPYELKDLFKEWLAAHYPLKAEHVMSLIRQSRGGEEYQSEFGTRMRGTGKYAELIAQRFRLACKRHGLGLGRRMGHDTTRFRVPSEAGQLSLWGE
ncbi:MAG: PA0069 family radical SAM protein [Gammaproteobacteria bacterium]|jgi:DNA repair photolyase|nr:PA0069 family radical SAM protein [Gammaproteobacteria bacterium]